MSYLDLPRINFGGRFFTNVSTINNRLTNYPPGAPILGGWNPDGTALFKFDGATVTGVEAPHDDGKLLNAPVTTPPDRYTGKLVDIDPQFQQLSQVIGVSIRVATDSGAGFEGVLEPCNFQDFWTPQPNTRGIAGASNGSVTYVSVLHSVVWTGNTDEVEALKLLRAASAESKLAIRFVIGSYYFESPDDPESGYGQLLGTIAPHHPGDPVQFARRRLMPLNAAHVGSPMHQHMTDPAAQLQACNFQLDKQAGRLSIDLANALPIDGFGGPPMDIGSLRAVILNDDGSTDPIDPPFSITASNYQALGGIQDLALSTGQVQGLSGQKAALEVQAADGDPWTLVLSEHRNGKYVNISPFTARVVGGDSIEFELRAFQWGEPLSEEPLTLTAEANFGKPDALVVNGGSGTAETGVDGRAFFKVETPTVLKIPPLREQLDSLAYSISGPWVNLNGGQNSGTQGLPVACLLVWAPYADAGIPNPTWEANVQPVFDEYMRIYPGMEAILDLRDLNVVLENIDAILTVFSLPFDDPHAMPVSRDLSPEKIAVIKTWLEQQKAAMQKS